MNRYVLDTNTVISAHLLPHSVSRAAYNKAMQSGIVLYSAESLSELVQVFFRPKFDKYISVENRNKAIAEFEKKGFKVDVNIKINACRDIKDNKFLELAVSGKASIIITGDNDLLCLNPYGTVGIINPSGFISSY